MPKRTEVVALNKDAKLLCVFPSITEAARQLGTTYNSLNGRLIKGKTYKQMLFLREPEYRKHWMDGTIDTLKFPSRKERIHARCVKRWKNATKEDRERLLNNLFNNRNKWLQRHSTKVICIETGEVFPSVADCSRKIGASNATVFKHIKDGGKVKGLTIKKYDNRNE